MNRRSDVRMSWPVVNVATAVPAAGTPHVSYRMTLSDLQGHHHHHRGKKQFAVTVRVGPTLRGPIHLFDGVFRRCEKTRLTFNF